MGKTVEKALLGLLLAMTLPFSLAIADDSDILQAGEISDDSVKVEVDKAHGRAKTKAKRQTEKLSKMAGSARGICKKAKASISKGKLDSAEKDLKLLKKKVKKARKLCKAVKKTVRGYSDLKRFCKKAVKKRDVIVGEMYDVKNRLAKARKTASSHSAAAKRLRTYGVVYSGGWRYTYYSQRVLPGYGLAIPGRHVGAYGIVRDSSGRVCVASSSHSKGTVLSTPFGTAKVYDTGCPYGTIDIYVNW